MQTVLIEKQPALFNEAMVEGQLVKVTASEITIETADGEAVTAKTNRAVCSIGYQFTGRWVVAALVRTPRTLRCRKLIILPGD